MRRHLDNDDSHYREPEVGLQVNESGQGDNLNLKLGRLEKDIAQQHKQHAEDSYSVHNQRIGQTF
jgi:hypothetical protein